MVAMTNDLPWPSYRRAVDLILLGHAKDTCLNGEKTLIGPRSSAARVPHPWSHFYCSRHPLETDTDQG